MPMHFLRSVEKVPKWPGKKNDFQILQFVYANKKLYSIKDF